MVTTILVTVTLYLLTDLFPPPRLVCTPAPWEMGWSPFCTWETQARRDDERAQGARAEWGFEPRPRRLPSRCACTWTFEAAPPGPGPRCFRSFWRLCSRWVSRTGRRNRVSPPAAGKPFFPVFQSRRELGLPGRVYLDGIFPSGGL